MKKSNSLLLLVAMFAMIGFFGVNVAHAQTTVDPTLVASGLSQVISTATNVVGTVSTEIAADQTITGMLSANLASISSRLAVYSSKPISSMSTSERAALYSDLSNALVTLNSARNTLMAISARNAYHVNVLGQLASVLSQVKAILISINS